MYYLEALEEEEETLAARLQTCSDEDRPAVREEHDALMAQAAEIIVKVCFLLFRVMLPVAVRVAAPLLGQLALCGRDAGALPTPDQRTHDRLARRLAEQ